MARSRGVLAAPAHRATVAEHPPFEPRQPARSAGNAGVTAEDPIPLCA